MSQTAPSNPALAATATPASSRTSRAQAAIAQAAQRTGVDFGYLLAQARIESGLDPEARARTSSATGLFQFIDQTWLATLDRHGERLGFGQLTQAIDTTGGTARITDPAMRQVIMGLRLDPEASALMAGALATDNAAALQPVLGRDPDASELYLAHFLGAEGAARFLTSLNSDPTVSAAGVLPNAARSNRAIFYDPSGAPRSVGEVMAVIRGRVESAMAQGTSLPEGAQFALAASAGMRAPRAAFAMPALPAAPAGVASMAATLESSFGLGPGNGRGTAGEDDPAAQPPGLAHVRRAYARLSAMGL